MSQRPASDIVSTEIADPITPQTQAFSSLAFLPLPRVPFPDTPSPRQEYLLKRFTVSELTRFLTTKRFAANCFCNICAPRLYYVHWFQSAKSEICAIDHQRTDDSLAPGKRSVSTYQAPSLEDRYEALHLAQVTIDSFSRETEASVEQKEAIAEFKKRVDMGLLVKLGRPTVENSEDLINDLVPLLNRIFFLGTISPDTFVNCHIVHPMLLESNIYGFIQSAQTKTGQWFHELFIDLKNMALSVSSHLIAKRLGTLLHEMLHAFITERACRTCCTAWHNVGIRLKDHGRGWHLIAAAIGEHAPALLGCKVDLGRLDTLASWHDRAEQFNGWLSPADRVAKALWIPSLHDLERFGFVEE